MIATGKEDHSSGAKDLRLMPFSSDAAAAKAHATAAAALEALAAAAAADISKVPTGGWIVVVSGKRNYVDFRERKGRRFVSNRCSRLSS